MTWITVILLAALIHSIGNIIDKYIIGHELHDAHIGSYMHGIAGFILFGATTLIAGTLIFDPYVIGVGIFAGLIYSFNAFMYYRILEGEEVTRFIPALSLSPIFVLIIAALFLQENLTIAHYIGGILVFTGIILTSIRQMNWKSFSNPFLYLAILCSFLFAIKNISTKLVANNVDVLSLLLWIGVGMGLYSVFIRLTHHHKIENHIEKKGFHHLMITAPLAMIGSILFNIAIGMGPVSLVSFLHKTQIVFVFIFGIILDIAAPAFLEEGISKKIVMQKMSAVGLILGGSFMLI